MKILFLEDESDFAQKFCSMFSKDNIDIEFTDDFIIFNNRIYKEPHINNYDFIIMDLNVNLGNLTINSFYKLCAYDDNVEHFVPTKLFDNGIELYGWDYFIHKVMNHKETKQLAYSKFIFITGHANLIKEKKLLERNGISPDRLLDKSTYYNDLKKIITITKSKR